jgi:hypothetical protein
VFVADDEFACTIGGVKCIPKTWHCDGDNDCRDSSDEANCKNYKCLDMQFSCGPPSNKCIYKTWVCDGDQDCPDGRDEANCTTTAPEGGDVSDQFISKVVVVKCFVS